MDSTPHAQLCVPVCASQASSLSDSIERAARCADIIEVRLDCLDEAEWEAARGALGRLLYSAELLSVPFIFTNRPAEEGGRRRLDARRRFSVWMDRNEWHDGEIYKPVFADIELDFVSSLTDLRSFEVRHNCTVICSHHDFSGVPADLERIYERMAETPARILKIAVRADDITDCIQIFSLLERARREGRSLIAVAMGEAGAWTRILAPSRGAFLTYGSLERSQATAPGQLTAEELRRVYRIDRIDRETQIAGLVGSPVSHSLSPHMHNAAFAACQINGVYLPFEVRALDGFMRRMVHPHTREMDWNLCGLSVTAPHKQAIMAHLDWIDPAAGEIGAVNTVCLRDGELHGYNTDAAAALAPLEGLIDLRGARAAVIGAGGAARSVLWSRRERGARATLFARYEERARETASRFDTELRSLDGAQFKDFELVVNATPLGTRRSSDASHEDETPVRSAQLRGAGVVYDLIYNPSETRLMREAREAGCRTVGGLGMLLAQGAEQFRLWTGREAPLEAMSKAARGALE